MKPGNRSMFDCGANSSKAAALRNKRGIPKPKPLLTREVFLLIETEYRSFTGVEPMKGSA